MKLWKTLPALLALLLAFNGCDWGDPPGRIVDGGGTEVDGLTGILVDAQGTPVANARVLVFPDTGAGLAKGLSKSLAALAAIRDSARSDAQGRYRIDSLPAGTYALLAGIVRNDTLLTVLVRGIAHDGGKRDLGVLFLQPGGRITVAIRSQGMPVAGARCAVAGLEGFEIASTSSGTCLLSGLPQGSFRVTVSHSSLGGGETAIVKVRPGRTTNGGEVDLVIGAGPIDTTTAPPDSNVYPDPLDPTLLAAFSFGEGSGTTAASVGRSGVTATLGNGASWSTAGAVGSALSLNGSTQYASAPNSALLSGMSELTVEAWVYPNSAPTTLQRIAAVWGPAGITDDSWSFSVTAAGRVTLEVTAASDNYDKSAVSTASVTAGKWNHIVGVYSNAGIRLYLNGVQVYSGNSVAGPLKSINRPLEIGAILGSAGSASSSWPGRIDELRIYNQARSTAQIQASYQTGPGAGTGTPVDTASSKASYFGVTSSTVALWNFNGLDASNRALDLSGNGLHLSRTGAPTLEASPHGSAAVFAGSSSQRFSVDYSNKMTIVPTGRLTLEARIYITEYASSSNLGGRSTILGAYAGPGIKLFNDGRFEVFYQRNKNGSDYWYSAWTLPAAVPLNRWVTIAASIDNTVTPQQFYAYIDGVPIQMYAADNVASNTDPFRTNYQAAFSVGGSAMDNEPLKGKIEEARFSNALVLGPGLPLRNGSEAPARP